MPFTSLRETSGVLTPTAAEQVAAKRVKEYEVKLDAMEQSVLTLKEVILALGKAQSEKERAYKELQEGIAKLEAHIDTLSTDRAQAALRLNELRAEILQQEQLRTQAHDDIDQAVAQVALAREQYAAVEADAKRVIAQEQDAVQAARADVTAAQRTVTALQGDVAALQARLAVHADVEQRITELRAQIVDAEKELERVQTLLEVTHEEQYKLEDEKDAALAALAAARKTMEEESAAHTRRIEEETAALIERERLVGLRETAWTAREERLSAKVDELKLKFPAEMAKLAL